MIKISTSIFGTLFCGATALFNPNLSFADLLSPALLHLRWTTVFEQNVESTSVSRVVVKASENRGKPFRQQMGRHNSAPKVEMDYPPQSKSGTTTTLLASSDSTDILKNLLTTENPETDSIEFAALPKGQKGMMWEFLDRWLGMRETLIRIEATMKDGSEVVLAEIIVAYTFGGTVDGRGKFITDGRIGVTQTSPDATKSEVTASVRGVHSDKDSTAVIPIEIFGSFEIGQEKILLLSFLEASGDGKAQKPFTQVKIIGKNG